MKIIEIKNLKKSFKDVKAVNDISFDVKKGDLFAFLGLNGAGKSTTINIICGNTEKDEGEVFINGISIDKYTDDTKRLLGVVYQTSALDKPLTVKDNLKSRANLYGLFGEELETRLNELYDIFDLHDILSRPVGKLSGGQLRRVDIARALIHKPQILILDEPTTGLDPQTRKMVWDTINDLRKKENITVFLTTHYMEEAADADYVVILDNGKISAEGTPLQLKNIYTGDFITLYNTTEKQVKSLGLPYEILPEAYRIEVQNTAQATELILANSQVFVDYEITKGKMDDVFLAVTGKKLGQGENNEKDK